MKEGLRMQNFGKFSIKEELLKSANSIIYRVTGSDGVSGIAKIPSDEHPDSYEIARYEREFAFLQRIDSPHVIKALELLRCGHRPALITEDIHGSDFQTELKKNGVFTMEKFLDCAIALCEGLQAIHAVGLIHKDLSLGNMILNSQKGIVKIIDLGISSELSTEKNQVKLAEEFEGSLPYISPEQTGRMNRAIDYRSDFYSLGMCFYEMLTGSPAFFFEDKQAYLHAHIAREPDLISDLNPAVPRIIASIVHKLIEKNAEDRYQSCYGIKEDLLVCQKNLRVGRVSESFPLASHDVLNRFEIRNAVYGRERDFQILLDSYCIVSKGGNQAVFVAGYSGVGKTSLIHELYKPITESHAIFVEGKFEQFKNKSPYSALSKALGKLMQQILTEPSESIQNFKQDLLRRIGRNAFLILPFVPNIEIIVGKLDEPNVEASDRRKLTQFALREFLAVVAQKFRGFVLFIDDMQWSDLSTIQFFEQILVHQPIPYFMLITSYRSNEVTEAHPLSGLLHELKNNGCIHEIDLQPLPVEVVRKIVAETLHQSEAAVESIAATVFQRTQGNPYYINELLKAWYAETVIYFDQADGSWHWDESRFNAANVSGDLADFISRKIFLLADDAKAMLPIAACLGHEFNLGDLIDITGKAGTDLLQMLWSAIEKGIVASYSDEIQILRYAQVDNEKELELRRLKFRFQHDKIHGAAYHALQEQDKKQVHLKIARTFSAHRRSEHSSLELVQHYLAARELIVDREEMRSILDLCLESVAITKLTGAFETAYKILEAVADIADQAKDHLPAELFFNYKLELFDCGFLVGKHTEIEQTFRWLQAHCNDLDQRIKIYDKRLFQLIVLGRLDESIDYGIKAIATLGFKIPAKPTTVDLLTSIFKFKRRMKNQNIGELVNLPLMTDPRFLATMRLCSDVLQSALLRGNKKLFAYLVLLRVTLTLEHGVAPSSAASITGLSILFTHRLKNLTAGADWGRLTLAMIEKHPGWGQVSRALGVYSLFVQFWNEKPEQFADTFKRCLQESFQSGDFFFLGITAANMVYYLESMRSSEAMEMIERHAEIIQSSGNPDALDQYFIYKRFWFGLANEAEFNFGFEKSITAPVFVEIMRQRNYVAGLFIYFTIEAKLAFLFGNWDQCNKMLREAEVYEADAAFMHKTYFDYLYIQYLAYARSWKLASASERSIHQKRMKSTHAYVRRFSKHNPAQFEHLYLLLEAEKANISGVRAEIVEQLYEKAIESSISFNDFWGGIANRQAALWAGSQQRSRLYRSYAEEAVYLLQRMGLGALVKRIQVDFGLVAGEEAAATDQPSTYRHTQMKAPTHSTVMMSTISFEDLFKRVQQLFDEVNNDQLLVKFARMMLECSGGQAVTLCLKDPDNGQLYRVIDANVQSPEVSRPSYQPIESHQLPLRVLNFVEMTRKSVLLNEASEEGDFVTDPYIQTKKIASLLCSPILRSGHLVGLVYLENSKAKAAFSKQQEEVVQVLAHQASASIQNALLYRSLEAKVKQKTRDLTVIMQHLKQGIFTIGEGGLIQEGFSDYLKEVMETSEIYRHNGLDFLFRQSNIGGDQLAQMANIIDFIGEDRMSYELNEHLLVHEITRTFRGNRQKILQFDWDPMFDEAGCMEKIMVTVRDITSIRAMELESARQREQLETLLILEKRPASVIASFLHDFTEISGRIAKTLADNTEAISMDALNLVFRLVHTQKGLTRLIDFKRLSDQLHFMESGLEALRRSHITFETWRENYQREAADVQSLMAMLEEGLRRLDARGTGTEEKWKAMKMHLRSVIKAHNDLESLKLALQRSVDRYDAQDLGALFEESLYALEAVASQRQKPLPVLQCSGSKASIRDQYLVDVKAILAHIVSNSFDHGLEVPEQRQALGKSPQGLIHVDIRTEATRLCVTIADDGSGLNLSKIQKKALEGGAIQPQVINDQWLAEQIFAPGLTTAEKLTDTSGRGVGLDAVKALIEALGGSIAVQFTAERRGDHRPFHFILQLPAACFLDDAGEAADRYRMSA